MLLTVLYSIIRCVGFAKFGDSQIAELSKKQKEKHPSHPHPSHPHPSPAHPSHPHPSPAHPVLKKVESSHGVRRVGSAEKHGPPVDQK